MGRDWFGYVNTLSSVFRAQEEQALESCQSQTHPYSILMHLPLGNVLYWNIRRDKSSPRVLSLLDEVRRKQLCCYFLDNMYLPPRKVMQ